ncbi:MAG: Major Facilitator Superfamily transporter [Clostridiaceae bacterium]|jgi:MFS family permease|nr:Major Facilitator Superfamily transporter [Clostridiaceae bacterium]
MTESTVILNDKLRNKETWNIILISVASCVSMFGTSIYNFAIGLYVLKITGSGLSFAVTLVLGILSTVIVNPFAGVLADKLHKKLLAVITDTISGLLLIGLYFVTNKYNLTIFMIYICTFLLNVFSTVYGISIESSRPNLVSEKRLISMNSINKVIESSSSILGPMIGGIVFALLDIKLFILINGTSFVISALLQLFIDFKFNYCSDGNDKEKINFLKDILEGINYLKCKKDILDMFKIFISLNFFIGLSINIPMPYIINNILKLSPKYFGIIQAAIPAGMILGAIVIKKVMEKYSYKSILKSACIMLSICMCAIGFSSILHYTVYKPAFYLIYFIVFMILAGIAISLIDIPIFYILQRTIPDYFRGRVLSIGIAIAKTVLPAALIISGVLIGITPSYLLPIIGGTLLCFFTLIRFK